MYRHIGFIGRFQPAHTGHANVVKQLLKKAGRISILIPNYRQHTNKNPLSGHEAKTVLALTLSDSEIPLHRISIRTVRRPKDDSTPPLQYTYRRLVKNSGTKLTVFTANPKVARELEAFGAPVALFNRIQARGGPVSSTEVRRRIMDGRPWNRFLTPNAHKFIVENGIDQRIRALSARGVG